MILGGRINLKHLRAFRAVAHYGHFTRAAESIGLSQPALSALISQLEEDLSVSLCNRTTRAVEMTPAGREFMTACVRILGDFESAILEARDYAQLRKGRLRVVALPSLARTVLPEVLARFQQLHPGVAVTVLDLPGDLLVERIVSGQADLGIGYAEPGSVLASVPLMTDRLIAVGLNGTFPDGKDITWADLADHDIIAMDHGTTVRRFMDDGAQRAGVNLRIAHESQQMPTAIAYARAGLGVAVLPSTAILQGEEADLAAYPITGPVVERGLSLLYRTGQPPSPAGEAFRDLIIERVGLIDHR